MTNQFHGDRTRAIFREAFERVEPHQRMIDTAMVAASNGDPAVLKAETGKGLSAWCSAEEAQLSINLDGASAGAHGGSLLMHRTRAHFDLIHAIRSHNAVEHWESKPKHIFQVRIARKQQVVGMKEVCVCVGGWGVSQSGPFKPCCAHTHRNILARRSAGTAPAPCTT